VIDLNGYGALLFKGALITVLVSFCALLFGLFLSLFGTLGEMSANKLIRYLTRSIGVLLRGLPELLVLFGIYFGISAFLSKIVGYSVQVNPFIAGVIALGLIFSAYATQTLRGAFMALSIGQGEAAAALGLSARRIFSHILFPQAWQIALPGLTNLWLVLLKDSALISLLGLSDLMYRAQMASSSTHQPFKFYFTAALIFLFLTTLSQLSFRKLYHPAHK
jgi:arginine transport system permease protein